MKRLVLSTLLAVLALAACATPAPPDDEATLAGASAASTVIFLARHAEALYPPPEDAPRNPPLSAMGQDRADALARLLADAGITRIHSTDYERTQETAAPLAALLGLPVASYDPGDLPGFAAQLSATPGRHVVLGHSNTTPELVAALGGEPGTPIDESIEFDRLYVVVIGADGAVTTSLLRYGEPTPADWQERAAERR
jgi:phosphohistidine phosphatase SixA